MDKALSELLEYCKSNHWVCPQPMFWNDLWKLLPRNNKGQAPPTPLILAAWWDTPAFMKQLRFLEHIQWAHDNGVLEKIDRFLRSLSEDQWHQIGE